LRFAGRVSDPEIAQRLRLMAADCQVEAQGEPSELGSYRDAVPNTHQMKRGKR